MKQVKFRDADLAERDGRNPRVLLVSNMYPSDKFPYYGTFVGNIARELTRDSVDLETCVVHKAEFRLAKLFFYLKFAICAFFRYHLGKYDVVYVHYIAHSFVPLLLSSLHRRNRVLLHVHGGDILRQVEVSAWYFRFKDFVANRALRRADGIVVPSEYYKGILVERFGVEPSLITVIASGGVDLSVFHPRARPDSDVFTVGYVGRLDPGKGVDTLLRAFALAFAQDDGAKCIITGGGQLRASLEDLARSLGLGSRVVFTGPRAQAELPDFISLFDVFVFPTERESESLGLVGLEAMACGVPVIGSRMGGLQDYLVDGENGFFFTPGDYSDLARMIDRFRALSVQDRARMTRVALDTAGRYDAIGESQKLLRLIESFD